MFLQSNFKKKILGEHNMEHHPYITLNDMTEITYSDIKKDKQGKEYVTIYFETPSEEYGFCDASINYPDGVFYKIHHYKNDKLQELMHHYQKIGALVLEFAKEMEEPCQNL